MTPQSIITLARHVLQDTDNTDYRQADAELLLYVNAGLSEISVIRPDWFQARGHFECTPGTVEQALTFADAQSLVKVVGIHEGRALTPFDLDTMDSFSPTWKEDTADDAIQWAAFPGDLLRFFIYPKAPGTAQVVDVIYTRNPTVVTLTDSITEVPKTAESALVDYVVYRAESKDDENVLNQRAAAFFTTFVAKIKGAAT